MLPGVHEGLDFCTPFLDCFRSVVGKFPALWEFDIDTERGANQGIRLVEIGKLLNNRTLHANAIHDFDLFVPFGRRGRRGGRRRRLGGQPEICACFWKGSSEVREKVGRRHFNARFLWVHKFVGSGALAIR